MTLRFSDSLLAQIRHIARTLPEEKLQTLINVMQQDELSIAELQKTLTQILPSPKWRQILTDLFHIWIQQDQQPSSKMIAAMLSTANYCQQAFEQELSLEFVWTGPLPDGSLFRRTDQALLQMIREAQQSLTIVSFAIYKIPEIVEALSQAELRGVQIMFIFEMPDVSDGKIAYGPLASLGSNLLQKSKLLVWAKHKRPVNAEGKIGSLHAKFAIADKQKLLVSSANLTNYAMTLNMEMGVLIHSSEFVMEAVQHIDQLIIEKVIISYFS